MGISQANRALTKPSRAKIRSKMFPLKNMLGLCYTFSLSLSLSLSLSIYIYIYIYLYLNLCRCLHYALDSVKLLIKFPVSTYISVCNMMLVQLFHRSEGALQTHSSSSSSILLGFFFFYLAWFLLLLLLLLYCLVSSSSSSFLGPDDVHLAMSVKSQSTIASLQRKEEQWLSLFVAPSSRCCSCCWWLWPSRVALEENPAVAPEVDRAAILEAVRVAILEVDRVAILEAVRVAILEADPVAIPEAGQAATPDPTQAATPDPTQAATPDSAQAATPDPTQAAVDLDPILGASLGQGAAVPVLVLLPGQWRSRW